MVCSLTPHLIRVFSRKLIVSCMVRSGYDEPLHYFMMVCVRLIHFKMVGKDPYITSLYTNERMFNIYVEHLSKMPTT